MKLPSKGLLPICCIITVGMIGCSNEFAGGTGVGNPTTEVTVSMRTLDDDQLITLLTNKLLADAESYERLAKSGVTRINTIAEFHITSARITVSRLKCYSETEETPWVDGPFMFDAITGESEPAEVTVAIPSGSYSGIKLHVTKKGHLSTDEPAIEVSGTFDHLGVTRAFSIALKCNLSVEYPVEAGTLELNPDAELHCAVVLDEEEWLSGTSIIECIGTGDIDLQDDGSLLIDETIPPGPCHSNENIIRQNILHSGKLEVQ